MSFDRYSKFRVNGNVGTIPGISLTRKNTDYTITYERGKTRLDRVSYDYYGDPNYDWLIMMANPQYGSLEFRIPNNAELVIPYPLNESLEDFKNKINNYETLY